MKKEFYYIRGSKERSAEVLKALLDKYPLVANPSEYEFNDKGFLYTVSPDDCNYITAFDEDEDYEACAIIKAYGTELHLPDLPKKTTGYKHGDVVIWQGKPCMVFDIDNHKLQKLPAVPADGDLAVGVTLETATRDGCAFATDAQTDEWNEQVLHPHHLHYSRTDRCMKRWFLPFDRVLVRNFDDAKWYCDIFSHYYDGGPFPNEVYKCIGGAYAQCILYTSATKHHIGTKVGYYED